MWAPDDRGQSVVIGTVILFGFLVIAISSYQVTIVPQQNSQREFAHEQTVRDDFVGVRDAVVATGTSGETVPASVTLGTEFPDRTWFINPPSAVGRLATGPPRQVTLNVSRATFAGGAAGETHELREGWPTAAATGGNYTTQPLVYTPQYRVYDGGPTNVSLVLSHAVATYPSGARLNLTETPLLVSGDQVTLFLLKGTLSRSGVQAVTVEPNAVSPVTDRQRVSNFEITVPTPLSAAQFETMVTRGSAVDASEVVVTENATRRAVDVRFPGEYGLAVAAVSVGRYDERRTPAAVEVVAADRNVTQATAATVTLRVRDQYGNTLPGATVTAGAAGFTDRTRQTDDTGTATVGFDTTDTDGAVAVNATVDDAVSPSVDGFDQTTAVNATANVTVVAPTADGNGTSGSWPFRWTDPDGVSQNASLTLTDCSTKSCTVDAGGTDAPLVLQVTTDGETSGATVSYDINDTAVASLNESTSLTTTAGNDTVTLRPEADGSSQLRVSATSGGTTTTIRINFENVNYSSPGNTGPGVTITAVQPDPAKLPDSDGEFVRIEIPSGVDTAGWTLADDDASQSLADRSGVVYFARDTSAFVDQWNLGAETVTTLDLRLNNGGEAVTLRDTAGDESDRFAYGTETFSDGSSFSFDDANAVGNRTNLVNGAYDDTDSQSDWSETNACRFFDGGNDCPAGLNTAQTGSPSNVGASGKAEFELTNTGDGPVEITGIAWNTTSSSATRVANGTPEFEAKGGGDDAEYAGIITLGGGRYTLDTTSTLAGGETQTYQFDRFEDNAGDSVSLSGESITITLYFGDSSQRTITLSF